MLGENCPRSRLCGRAVSVCAAVSLVRLLARRVCLCVSWRFRVRPSGKFSLSGTLCRRSRSSSTLSHGRWEPLDPSSLLFFTTIPPRRSAAMAAAAAAVDPALEAVFQSTREAVAALHVSPVATRRKAPGEGLASLEEVRHGSTIHSAVLLPRPSFHWQYRRRSCGQCGRGVSQQ